MGASAAKGATLQGKNVTWQTIPGLGDINFPLPEVEIVDITSQDSPANHDEKLPTLLKGQSLSIPVNKWDDSAAMHLWLVANNGTVQGFKYTGAGAPSANAFNAIIMVAFENPVKGQKKATIKLEVSDGNIPT